MGGRSNSTKYATELPVLFAIVSKEDLGLDFHARPLENLLDVSRFVDQNKVLTDIRKALPIALESGTAEFVRNFKQAKDYVDRIEKYCEANNLGSIGRVDWQGDQNINTNDTPSDILFENHPLGGISVKAGAPNLFNLGTKELVGDLKGIDLFEHLAPEQFRSLMSAVKQTLVSSLCVGDTWTDPSRNEHDMGKYAIQRLSEDLFEIRYKKSKVQVTEQQLLAGEFVTAKGVTKPIAKRAHRVFGDYYQKNKDQFKEIRDSLYTTIKPKLIDIFKQSVITNTDRLSQLGGFAERAYFYVDFGKRSVYYVPSISDVRESLKVDIVSKDGTFGAGLELLCELKTQDTDDPTTVEWHIRYHTGTFAGPPQNMIQGLRNKENIWVPL